jgi:hypothetical protein
MISQRYHRESASSSDGSWTWLGSARNLESEVSPFDQLAPEFNSQVSMKAIGTSRFQRKPFGNRRTRQENGPNEGNGPRRKRLRGGLSRISHRIKEK